MSAYRTPAEQPSEVEPAAPWYYEHSKRRLAYLPLPLVCTWIGVWLDKLCEHASHRVDVGVTLSFGFIVFAAGAAAIADAAEGRDWR